MSFLDAVEVRLDLSPGIWYFLGQLDKALLSPGSHASLTSLFAAFMIAVMVLAVRRLRKGRRVRLRPLMRALFPKSIVSSRSNVADIGYFYFNVFVFGMVFPLFVMALVWDKAHLAERRWMRPRPVRLRAAGRVLVTNTLNLGVAAAFTVMGVLVFYLAATGAMSGGSGVQGDIGRGLAGGFERIQVWLAPVPEAVLGLGLLALAAVFVVATLRRRPPAGPDDPDLADPADHHTDSLPDRPSPAQTPAASKENRS